MKLGKTAIILTGAALGIVATCTLTYAVMKKSDCIGKIKERIEDLKDKIDTLVDFNDYYGENVEDYII